MSAYSNLPTITCWGAAQAVTGSMHLLEAGPFKLLLDCGLVVGRHVEAALHNGSFPFDPQALDAVVVTHAHVDHCGNLPALVSQGFRGSIYCTPATRDLLGLVLADSARFKEREAFAESVVGRPEEPPVPPLFTRPDVDEVLVHTVPLDYGIPREIHPGVELLLLDAGHVLGSAMAHVSLTVAGRAYSLAYTGDRGRHGLSLLRDPSPVPPADLILCESTYGGRFHEPWEQTVRTLTEMVRRTVERGGKVLIPSFSLGRTQLVIHTLRQEMEAGRAPRVPVFVDSPLAADIADVYRRYPGSLKGAPDFLPDEQPEDSPIRYIRSREESHDLSLRREPCVLVASGGMVEGGRSLHHLKHLVDDPRCTIALVSYQAPHTVGRRLLERGPTVRFHGRKWNKWAEVIELPGFSGHADQRDFLAALGPLVGQVGKVRLVHGETEQADALAAALRGQGFADVAVPERGDRVALG